MIWMQRREFITLLGGAAAAWPLAASAQQTARSRKVGLLHPGESTVVSARVVAIREGLSGPDNQRDTGVELVIRLADGDVSRLPALATELVNDRVDTIIAAAPPAVFPDIARGGGLLGYGPELQDLYRQVGAMARKILQGAKVAELPVERPTR